MTIEDYKEKVMSKYFEGQEVNLRIRDTKGKIIERKKAKILKYYPHLILCEVDRNKESFTYSDFNGLITYGGKGWEFDRKRKEKRIS